jgi:hypothetical protein
MSGSFNRSGELSLMFSANSSPFSCPDFSKTRNKLPKKFNIFEINFSDVALTEITRHT